MAGDTVLGAVADAGLALGDFGGDPAQREHVKHLLGAVERGLPAFGATSTGRAIAGDGFHIGAARADAPLLQVAAVPAEVHRVDIRAGALNIEGVTGGELVERAGQAALVLAGIEFVFAGGDVSAPQADLQVHHIVQEGEVRQQTQPLEGGDPLLVEEVVDLLGDEADGTLNFLELVLPDLIDLPGGLQGLEALAVFVEALLASTQGVQVCLATLGDQAQLGCQSRRVGGPAAQSCLRLIIGEAPERVDEGIHDPGQAAGLGIDEFVHPVHHGWSASTCVENVSDRAHAAQFHGVEDASE